MGGWDPRGLSVRYGGWVHPAIQQRIDALWEDSVGPSMLAMTAEEAAQTMRDYIAKGVDFVKVGVSGHSLGPVEPLMFSPEVLKAICDEVHKAGLPLATHTFTVESLRLAIDNKPDLLVHPNVMSVPWQAASDAQKTAIRQQIKRAADAGIYAALMAVPVKLQLETYREWDALNYEGDFWVNQIMNGRRPFMGGTDYETAVAGLREWIASDVKLTFGTDAGPDSADLGPVVWGRLGRMHFSRMVGLQDAGMTPMDIIIASTRHPAEAYHLDDELGTLEAGKVADLLVLDRDPLADIANMNSINRVIKGGVIVDRDTLPTIKVLDYDPEKEWPE
jgi:imidazolonepropionase-like amidohydrolase